MTEDVAARVMRSRDRILYIDVFRGVAIALVTGFHLWRRGKPTLQWDGPLGTFDLLGVLANGGVGVDLFFFVSGFCMALGSLPDAALGYKAYLRYVGARLSRIVPPYYAAIVFWNLAVRYAPVPPKPVGLVDNLSHLLFVHNFSPATFFSVSGVFWSIAVEVQFYLLLPLALPFLRRSSWAVLLSTLVVSALINATCVAPLYTWSAPSFLPLFLAGSACAIHRERVVRVLARPGRAWLSCGAAFLIMTMIPHLDERNTLLRMTCGLFLGLSMLAWSEDIERRPGVLLRGMAWLGRISFSLYLYNYVLTLALPIRGPLGVLLRVALVLGVGSLMYYAIEAPSLRLRAKWSRAFKANADEGAVQAPAAHANQG